MHTYHLIVRRFITSTATAVFLILLSVQHAAAQFGLNEAAPTEIKKDFETSLGGILQIVLGYVGGLFLALIIVGGILWMTAGGNDQKIERAKKIIMGAAVGLIIIMTAYIITYWLTVVLSGASTETTTP